MATFMFGEALKKSLTGSIDFDTDTFKVLLVTSGYVPNEDTHDFRDDVTNEVTGTGYSSGGASITATVTHDTANNRVTVAWSQVTWPSSTITARGGVVYKSRGGAASADELVMYIDFTVDQVTTGGTFTLNAGTMIFQR